MAQLADMPAIAARARRSFAENLSEGIPGVLQSVQAAARALVGEVAEPHLVMRRRQLVEDLQRWLPDWESQIQTLIQRAVAAPGISLSNLGALPSLQTADARLGLVDNAAIESEILSSRFALAMMDRASWEFTDLRSRMTMLEGREELNPADILRPHVLARIVSSAWQTAGLRQESWRLLQSVLHEEFARFLEEAYHESNRQLIAQGVLPEIDLRPLIRRSAEHSGPVSVQLGPDVAREPFWNATRSTVGSLSSGRNDTKATPSAGQVADETRLLTRPAVFVKSVDQADAVLGRLNRLIGRQLPGFAQTASAAPASPSLSQAIGEAQRGIVQRLGDLATVSTGGSATASSQVVLEELHQRKQLLKRAAATPVERATIEIVALLFQSLLTEERLPATVRIWFARLQMPVLRVAVGEPDFFATADHPARRLIDRMGACVMGFDTGRQTAGDLLEKEIKRVVQVVEAYPDTGRRVFQTVLTEFEKFLEHYFRNDNEASRKGVSLAQQVEHRETLAIQYTIELRKMLSEMPVQEGIREFLFQIWADVLAMTAVKSGLQSAEIKNMKRAAADLIWSAGAKVSREERAAVIRRLPPLLKTLRDGMSHAGLSPSKQDDHISRLNSSLAAAFTARSAAISRVRLEELMARLETLEELLPDADESEIDESLMSDLSGHESADLEVVSEGGSMPTKAMVELARTLQIGSWYKLDYRNRNEAVQVAWHGMRRQMTLFVSPQGRGILFQQSRLAAFLQAGLLLPAQEESLTVRATRSALAKIDADPSRLLD